MRAEQCPSRHFALTEHRDRKSPERFKRQVAALVAADLSLAQPPLANVVMISSLSTLCIYQNVQPNAALERRFRCVPIDLDASGTLLGSTWLVHEVGLAIS